MIYDAVRNDGWEFWLVWGIKGHGKTTLALELAHRFYRSWKKVFDHLVFTDAQLRNKILAFEDDPDYRVPLMVWDDPGVFMSKYKYRDLLAVEFIEFFVAIRPRLAVLIMAAPLPTSILKGLRQDLTATIFLPKRGWYIFQRHVWQEDFHSINARFRKIKIQEGPFPAIDNDVFDRYKRLRHTNLLERKFKRLKVLEEQDMVAKLVEPDFCALKQIYEHHDFSRRAFRKGGTWEQYKGNLSKLEAYGLVTSSQGTIHITDLGERIYYLGKDQTFPKIPPPYINKK